MFKKGEKVVCVKNYYDWNSKAYDLIKGEIYTIFDSNTNTSLLAEIQDKNHSFCVQYSNEKFISLNKSRKIKIEKVR